LILQNTILSWMEVQKNDYT